MAFERTRSRGATFVLLVLLACGDDTLFVAKPWPRDALGIVLLLDDSASPRFAPPKIVLPGERLDLELVADEDRQLVAASYPLDQRASDGSPLTECGVTLEGSGRSLPPAIGEWRSELVRAGDDVSLEALPLGEHIGIELREHVCHVVDPCRGLTFEAPILRCRHAYRAAVASSDSVAHAIHARATIPRGSVNRIEPDGCTDIVQEDGLAYAVGLASTSSTTLIAAAVTASVGQSRIYGIDLARPSAEPRLDVALANPYMGQSPTGRMLFGGSTGLYALSPDGRTLTRDDTFVGQPQEIEIVADDRILVSDWQDSLQYFNGQTWGKEWIRPIGGPLRIRTVAGSLEHFYAAGDNAILMERDEVRRSWAEREIAFDLSGGAKIIASSVLADGRLILVGETGMLLAGAPGAWCALQADGSADVYNLVATSPSKRVAFLFSQNGVRRLVLDEP